MRPKKIMKIYIKNVSNTFNYGSMMMAENLITYLNKELSILPKYYIDAKEEIHVTRLKESTKYHEIYMDKAYSLKEGTPKNILDKVFKKLKREYTYSIKKCPYDIVIVLGGDDYSEIYYKIPEQSKYVINILKQLDKLNKKAKVFMLGQTIGPYTGERLECAKRVFSNVKILTRDDVSCNYIKETMDINAIKMRDLAFLDLRLEEECVCKAQEILNEYSLKENEYITVVGSGLYSCYTNNENEYNKAFINILNLLKAKYLDKKIVVLSHVSNKDKVHSDTTFISKIQKNIPEDVIVIDEQMLPVKARIILGYGYFTVTYRMHAAVSTYHMLKPAICFAYSPKYVGVIGDGLNRHDLIISLDKENFKSENILKELDKKIEYLENNRENIIKEISESTAICKEKALYGINQITSYIESRENKYE